MTEQLKQALARLDALADPSNGLLAVPANSATALAIRADLSLIRTALTTSQPAQAGEVDESAWLIEQLALRGSSTRYFTGRPDHTGRAEFSTDSLQAVRFNRQEDAERMLTMLDLIDARLQRGPEWKPGQTIGMGRLILGKDCYRVTEHMWPTQPAAQATHEPVANGRDCPHCNYTGSMHCGDVAEKYKAACDPKDCSHAKVFGLRAATPPQQAAGEPVGDAYHVKLLIEAIGAAAQKAGIYNGQVPLTGPLALMLVDDMATCTTHPAPGVPEDVRTALADLHAVMLESMGTGGWVPTPLHQSFVLAMADAGKALAAAQAKGADHAR